MGTIGIIVLISIVVLGGGGAAYYFFFMRSSETTVVQERLGRYAESAVQAAPQVAEKQTKPKGSALGEKFNEALQGRSFFASTQLWLNAADLKINVGEFLALCIICAIAGIVIGVLATAGQDCTSSPQGLFNCLAGRDYKDAMFMSLISGVVGVVAPRFYVDSRKAGRLQAFDGQLGDTLNLLVNALRSGYSVLQAMEAVSKELPPPISVEFRRVVQEIQLGLPMETALAHLLERMASEDLDLVITAMNIQREVGGNLAEILDVMSNTIRERVRIKGEIETLTSQGLATGFAITGMPFALGIMLFLINRPYIMQFFEARNQPCGWGMIIGALLLIGIGGFSIKKIITIEV